MVLKVRLVLNIFICKEGSITFVVCNFCARSNKRNIGLLLIQECFVVSLGLPSYFDENQDSPPYYDIVNLVVNTVEMFYYLRLVSTFSFSMIC